MPTTTRTRAAAVLALCLLAGALASRISAAGAKNYAYLFVQGRLTDSRGVTPMSGATIRLLGEGRVLEAVSDRRGVFVFEKIPVATYDLEIVTADGRVMQGVADADPIDPSRVSIRLRHRRGKGAPIVVEAAQDGVAFDVPKRRTNWPKLWAEIFIFAGVALALAL